ncbi:MAG: PQQ-dependent sugar dehydrogenase, partial [Candidatus Binatia bacterium]
LDVRDGWLYVAETSAIGRVRLGADEGHLQGDYERIVTGLPEGGNHWTRTIRFGPDGKLYATVGSSCNACFEKDPRRAAMLRFEPDGSGGRIWASGLRNSVDFDWRPETGDLYATDNGRDLLGDDEPPCELNRIVEGGFYGWPIANGDRVADPDHGEGRSPGIARSLPPVHGFRPHTAPLGIAFLRDPRWPDEYRGAAVVALHGSWNRTKKIGYEVVTLHWNADGTIEERKLLTGLLENEDVIGRPVGVAEGPDGAVYVSDDYAGLIYRIGRGESAAEPARRRRGSERAGTGALDPRAVARGRDLFAAKECAVCHDPVTKLQGMVARPLAGLSNRYTVATLASFLDAPTPPMPRVGLDEAERSDLAAYLLATFP